MQRNESSAAAPKSVSKKIDSENLVALPDLQQRSGRFTHEVGFAEDLHPLTAFRRLIAAMTLPLVDMTSIRGDRAG